MNTKHRKTVITSVIAVFFFSAISLTVWGASTKSILNQFQFEQNNPTTNIMRQIAWSMATGLHWLVKGLEDVIYNINTTLGGFFISEQIQELQNKIMVLAIALIVLLILFIGIMHMIKPQQVTTIISNLIIGVVIAIAIPTLLSTAYNFSNQAIIYINSDSNGDLKKVSDRILLDNVIDVTRYETEKFKSTTLKYKNSFVMPGGNVEKITTINPTELIDPNQMKSEVWAHKIVDQKGKQVVEEINSGFFRVPILSENYYRWKFDWFTIFSTLLVTGIALTFSGVKIARLLYELAIHQVLTQIVALLDVMTAQRLKKCLQTLVATFATLIAVFFMLQMFIIGMVYISNVTNVFLRLLLMVALAWSVIDGPDLFAQIMGVDAGINGALRTAYGLKAASGMMTGAVAFMGGRTLLDTMKTNGAIGTAKSAVSKVGGIVGGVAGAVTGTASAAHETRQRMDNIKSNFAQAPVKKGTETSTQTKTSSPAQKPSSTGKFIKRQTSESAPISSFGSFMPGGGIGDDEASRATRNLNQHSRSAEAITGAETSQSVRLPGSTTQSSQNVISGSQNHVPPSVSGVNSSVRLDNNLPQTQTPISAAPQKPDTPSTIGGYIGSAISSRFQNSSPAVSARRAYALTKGSVQQQGNKRVMKEEKTQQIMQSQPNITRRDAKKLAQKEIRKEQKNSTSSQSWADQERSLERSEELHERGELK